MFTWSNESIEWYKRAIDKSDYFLGLSKLVASIVDKNEIIYDLGCGLGEIDIELAPYVKHITAIDIEPKVIKELCLRAKEKHIKNITPCAIDWENIENEVCDTVMACSFGFLEETLEPFMNMCRKRLLIIKKVKHESFRRPYSKTELPPVAEREEKFLKENNIDFNVHPVTLEFGQPIKNLEEAAMFINHYRLKPQSMTMEDYLSKHVVLSGDDEYPYYIPNTKNMQLIVIDKVVKHEN